MANTEAFWEELYLSRAGGANIWSGNVNAQLAAAVEELPPGRALDLGCGEGGDSVHLARLDWQVTAIDVSPTALSRTREMAAAAGVSSLVTTERHDLASSFPSGSFDLVVAMFFQSPLELPRERVLHRAADSLAPGGHLVVVEHGSGPTGSEQPPTGSDHHDMEFATPEELVALIDLDPARFTPLTVEGRSRPVTHEGRSGTVLDTVVVVRRDG